MRAEFLNGNNVRTAISGTDYRHPNPFNQPFSDSLRKKIEGYLYAAYPEKFIPLYTLVSFASGSPQ